MKKLGLLIIALVLALGTLGVGYARWSDNISIRGTVESGEVCFSIRDLSWEEVGGCPDKNWGDWVYDGFSTSCPFGYHFEDIGPAPEGKCPATVSFTPHYDADGNVDSLQVTVDNAYPYFLGDISFYVCNCGTIPIVIQAPIIQQDPFLLIEYGDNIGRQIHTGQCVEISFLVGVTQHANNDPAQDMIEMNSSYSFTISIEAVQWNEA
jgi:hypothetical protein